jgi:nitrogen fixation NifU-like protein
LCGDRIQLYVTLKNDLITEVGFQGSGCAISRASTSMMTESVKGKSLEQINIIFDEVRKMLTEPGSDLNADIRRSGNVIRSY